MSEGVKRQIVLGAGASDGFPLGSELLKILKKDVKNYIEDFILPKSEVSILSKSDSKPYQYYQKEIIKINLIFNKKFQKIQFYRIKLNKYNNKMKNINKKYNKFKEIIKTFKLNLTY